MMKKVVYLIGAVFMLLLGVLYGALGEAVSSRMFVGFGWMLAFMSIGEMHR